MKCQNLQNLGRVPLTREERPRLQLKHTGWGGQTDGVSGQRSVWQRAVGRLKVFAALLGESSPARHSSLLPRLQCLGMYSRTTVTNGKAVWNQQLLCHKFAAVQPLIFTRVLSRARVCVCVCFTQDSTGQNQLSNTVRLADNTRVHQQLVTLCIQ